MSALPLPSPCLRCKPRSERRLRAQPAKHKVGSRTVTRPFLPLAPPIGGLRKPGSVSGHRHQEERQPLALARHRVTLPRREPEHERRPLGVEVGQEITRVDVGRRHLARTLGEVPHRHDRRTARLRVRDQSVSVGPSSRIPIARSPGRVNRLRPFTSFRVACGSTLADHGDAGGNASRHAERESDWPRPTPLAFGLEAQGASRPRRARPGRAAG